MDCESEGVLPLLKPAVLLGPDVDVESEVSDLDAVLHREAHAEVIVHVDLVLDVCVQAVLLSKLGDVDAQDIVKGFGLELDREGFGDKPLEDVLYSTLVDEDLVVVRSFKPISLDLAALGLVLSSS